MRESSEPSRRSVEIREKIGQHVRGVLTAGYIAAAGITFQPIIFQGFDDALAAKQPKNDVPKKSEKAPESAWAPHDITPFIQKMRSPEAHRVLSVGSDKELLDLLAEQPLIRRMRDPMLSNAELGRFYPRERPMVDPNFPKSNVVGVRDASMTFIPIRYRTRDGKTIRRGGTRVGHDSVLLTFRTAAERSGQSLLGTSIEEGFNASVIQETFGDGYEKAPILSTKLRQNADVHLTYGSIVGAPKESNEQKARLEGDGGLLIDLAQAPAIRRYLVQKSNVAGNPEGAKKLDHFLSKSVFLLSTGSEDEDTDETVRRFQDDSDGWQVFSAQNSVASKGDTQFTFAGIHAWTVRILDQKGSSRLTGYVVTGPAAIQSAVSEFEKKRGNKR